VPRSSHGALVAATDRPDPIAQLEAQAATRIQELVPIRYGRMVATPFTFYRGAAAVMASDLGAGPQSGLTTQLVGDAHLSNFGGFASPERALVFDINDFDETHPGPFEWDVKRLAASIEIAGRHRGFEESARRATVLATVRSYREAMREFAIMSNLDIWYARLDVEGMLSRYSSEIGKSTHKRLQRTVTKAESKDRLKAKTKLTETVDGQLRFRSDPPLLVRIEELFDPALHAQLDDAIHGAFDRYRETLPDDRRHLVESYRFVDVARKVVGVGSVGTRSWVALLVGRDESDPLFLQIKEAVPSVLEPYTQPCEFENQGERVVAGQRLMQAASDIFLGWQHVEGVDGSAHQYYMRQLWDWKASADIETMVPELFNVYGQMCGWALARGHARSGDAIAIGAYLGGSDTFDQAIVEFSLAYADQNELDHAALVAAIESGRLQAQTGL